MFFYHLQDINQHNIKHHAEQRLPVFSQGSAEFLCAPLVGRGLFLGLSEDWLYFISVVSNCTPGLNCTPFCSFSRYSSSSALEKCRPPPTADFSRARGFGAGTSPRVRPSAFPPSLMRRSASSHAEAGSAAQTQARHLAPLAVGWRPPRRRPSRARRLPGGTASGSNRRPAGRGWRTAL